MDEIARLEELFRRTLEGNAWHGPALRELLRDVTPAQAAAHPVPGAHSIWELVLHIAAWEDVVRRRLEGETVDTIPDEENFPPVRDTSEAAWRRALERLEANRARVVATLRGMPASRLDEPASKDVRGTNYVMVHGLVHHDLYHGGQIALLKRALT